MEDFRIRVSSHKKSKPSSWEGSIELLHNIRIAIMWSSIPDKVPDNKLVLLTFYEAN